METVDKVADNRNLIDDSRGEYRKKLDDYNTKIDVEKSKIRNLDDIADLVVSLNKSVNTCVSLLRESMKGKNITNKLNSIEESNIINLNRTLESLDIKKEKIQNNIASINKEKERYEDKYRNKDNTIEEDEDDK